MTAIDALRARFRQIEDLKAVGAVLDWDQSTYMPPGGAEGRGRQLALVGRLVHDLVTAPETGRAIDDAAREVERRGDEGIDHALVRAARREYDRATRLPSEFVGEMREHLAASFVAWTRARPDDDFARMRPLLEKTVEMSRRYADYFPGADHPADPRIDENDEGMTAEGVKALFADLRGVLVPLVRRIGERPAPEDGFLRGDFPEEAQLALGREVIGQLGYDFERGRQDLTHHPFMTKFGAGDVRITTRVRRDDLIDAFFSTIHECGHALYEQGISPELAATPLGHGVSAGVHESQSRLWENMVGRGRPFWDHHYPTFVDRFPEALRDVPVEAFHRAINRVEPSLIRVDADEVTYNLHIMIRFELELDLLEGKLAVADLPDAWRALYRRDLGVEPPDDRQGVLQDVHWFTELVGGTFQGYALGNVMAAQFYVAACRDEPGIPDAIGNGQAEPLLRWLREHVHRHGGTHLPLELVERATGKPLGIEDFSTYLGEKFGALYGL